MYFTLCRQRKPHLCVGCLCGAVGVCGECHRVSHVERKLTPDGIVDQKVLKILLFFTLISSSSPSLLYDNLKEHEIRMPGTQGKMEVRNFGGPGLAGHPVCTQQRGTNKMKESPHHRQPQCSKLYQHSKDTNRPAKSTRPCHTSFSLVVPSHHNPLLSCHGPFTVRGEHPCRDIIPLGSITQLPGLSMSRATWPLNATFASSQSCRKKRSCHQAHTTR